MTLKEGVRTAVVVQLEIESGIVNVNIAMIRQTLRWTSVYTTYTPEHFCSLGFTNKHAVFPVRYIHYDITKRTESCGTVH